MSQSDCDLHQINHCHSIYIVGGWVGDYDSGHNSDIVYIIDTESRNVSTSTLPYSVSSLSTVMVGGSIYGLGGWNAEKNWWDGHSLDPLIKHELFSSESVHFNHFNNFSDVFYRYLDQGHGGGDWPATHCEPVYVQMTEFGTFTTAQIRKSEALQNMTTNMTRYAIAQSAADNGVSRDKFWMTFSNVSGAVCLEYTMCSWYILQLTALKYVIQNEDDEINSAIMRNLNITKFKIISF